MLISIHFWIFTKALAFPMHPADPSQTSTVPCRTGPFRNASDTGAVPGRPKHRGAK